MVLLKVMHEPMAELGPEFISSYGNNGYWIDPASIPYLWSSAKSLEFLCAKNMRFWWSENLRVNLNNHRLAFPSEMGQFRGNGHGERSVKEIHGAGNRQSQCVAWTRCGWEPILSLLCSFVLLMPTLFTDEFWSPHLPPCFGGGSPQPKSRGDQMREIHLRMFVKKVCPFSAPYFFISLHAPDS